MKKLFFFALFTLAFWKLTAQSSTSNSARSIAMGGTGINFQDANSIFHNQAGLAYLDTWQGIINAESRFIRSPINNFGVGAILPSDFGTFGLVLHHFGIEAFNNQKIGLAYGRKLAKGFSLGAQFDFINVNIPEYGSKGTVTFEMGVQATITKEIRLGVHVFSPRNIEFVEDFTIPTIYKAGIIYTPSSKTFLSLELEKDLDFPLRIRTGLEYRFIDAFYMRVGTATAPSLVSLGLGVKVPSGLQVDIASAYHQVLGITPSLSMTYTPKHKKSR